MKYLLFIAFLTAATIAQGQTVYTCKAKTQAGTECSRKVTGAGVKCWQHGGSTKAQIAGTGAATAQCGAITKSTGLPCKNRVKGGGRCHLHK